MKPPEEVTVTIGLLMIAGPLPGQRLQRGPLGLDALGMMGVLAADDLVDEAAIGGEIVEVVAAAHQQRVARPPS